MPSIQGTDSGPGFGVQGTSGTGNGVEGNSKTGAGVVAASRNGTGLAATSKTAIAIKAESFAPNQSAILGTNNATNGIGVAGQSSTGNGVFGQSDTGIGIAGVCAQGVAVSGVSKENHGLLGVSHSKTSSGILGANVNDKAQDGNGVTGLSESAFGVFGSTNNKSQTDKRIVAGVGGMSNGMGWGVLGISDEGPAALMGISKKGDGARGEGHNGISGISTTNASGCGVKGEHRVFGGTAVKGIAAEGFGVVGISGLGSTLGNYAGVCGSSNRGPAVMGLGISKQPGIFAMGLPNAIVCSGDIGANGAIVALKNPVAGSFGGNVNIVGTLQATSKLFTIDHPLDPANKFLNHASVESSEMKTIYDGVISLNKKGEAIIKLPAWFEALNKNFRYQLTAIGRAAPGLHIATEISGNSFKIAGGPAGIKVCWQVTGVRHDPFARAEPLEVETKKDKQERGYFLHPEYHDHPKENGVVYVRHPDLVNLKPVQKKSTGKKQERNR